MKQLFSDKIVIAISYIFMVLLTIFCLYPMLVIIGVSFSDEYLVSIHGFKMIPEKLSLDTYKFVIENGKEWILNSYTVTIFITLVGTISSLIVTSLLAYAISIKTLRYRNIISFFCYITVIFNAGLVPTYIIIVKYYRLSNNLLVMILPIMLSIINMYFLKNSFDSIPDAMYESAKIDGANEFCIYYMITIPLSKTIIMTIGMFYALGYWNDWFQALLYIRNDHLFPLQYRLYSILSNVQAAASLGNTSAISKVVLPTETLKAVVTIITMGPIVFAYPFVQKYFVKGIMVGAVKS